MAYYKRVFAKPCRYKKIIFRSHLERDFAVYLDKNKIKWQYEKNKFELLSKEQYFDETDGKMHTLRNVLFIPDFYLPEYNLIVEIKGYPYNDRLFHLKLRLFKHLYKNRKICVINGREEFEKIKDILKLLKNKTYKSRNEFVNDDGLTDEEKIEIMQSILEAEKEKEKGE